MKSATTIARWRLVEEFGSAYTDTTHQLLQKVRQMVAQRNRWFQYNAAEQMFNLMRSSSMLNNSCLEWFK